MTVVEGDSNADDFVMVDGTTPTTSSTTEPPTAETLPPTKEMASVSISDTNTKETESKAETQEMEKEKEKESPEEEPKFKRPDFVEGNELDLAFALDCTGSMGSYIHSATQSIKDIAQKLIQSEKAKINFSLVCYRDHPPQDHTYITNVYPFTDNLDTMKSYLSKQQASGGGDGPEAVTAALHEVLHLPWRPNATKVLVIIADAPPHGLGNPGDGFPNGDPDGRDPLKIVAEMRAHGICIFSVACEPSLSSYFAGVDFFDFLATATGGSLMPLTSASLLPDVIVGGAKEQMEMEKLLEQYERDAKEAKKFGAKTDDEVSAYVHKEWSKRGVQTTQMVVDDIYNPASKAAAQYNVQQYFGSASLAEASKKTKAVDDRIDRTKVGGFGGTGGVFGAPRAGSGGFGSAPSPFGAPAPPGTSLFGSSTYTSAPPITSTGSTFGASSLFGSAPTPASTGSGSLFGGAPASGTFGSAAAPGAPPAASPFSFGSSTAPPAPPAPPLSAPSAPSLFGGPPMPGPPPPPPAGPLFGASTSTNGYGFGSAARTPAYSQQVAQKTDTISLAQMQRLHMQSVNKRMASPAPPTADEDL
ncbi:hypothetical protein HDV00_004498 [Rhizophlyctis rosea]|nr:hypothetical protein HDV00_004498 [Rhizophlyctis rosea]